MELKEIYSEIIVKTPTENEAGELLEILHKNGYTWVDEGSLLATTEWYNHKSDTCYYISSYCDHEVAYGTIRDVSEEKHILSLEEFKMEYELKEEQKMELNLFEILRGHEGETFWSDIYGHIKLIDVKENLKELIFDKDELEYYIVVQKNGKIVDEGSIVVFPSKEQRDWNKWVENQKLKVPKTWKELVKLGSTDDIRTMVSRDEHNNTLIVKAVNALLKIYQLIETGYGGIVSDKEWSNGNKIKHTIMAEGNRLKKDISFWTKSPIAFHTMEQRNEFMSHPENVQLIKDFYMI